MYDLIRESEYSIADKFSIHKFANQDEHGLRSGLFGIENVVGVVDSLDEY